MRIMRVRTPDGEVVYGHATGGLLLARIRRIMLLPDERSASRRGVGRTLLVAVAAI